MLPYSLHKCSNLFVIIQITYYVTYLQLVRVRIQTVWYPHAIKSHEINFLKT